MRLLLAVVFLPMLLEAVRAFRNEEAQRARGGIEPPGDVYGVMAAAYPGAFLLMIGEGIYQGAPAPKALAAGAALFVLAKALKWWAITTLGQAWTFRVIVVPGGARVSGGPYRFLGHPNYVAVVGEMVGVAMMAGAWLTGPIATLIFIGLMMKRVGVERAALDAILPRT